MGNYKNKAYPLRLDNELREKVQIIADKELRPLSKQYEKIIREYVEAYESKNGTIKTISIGNIGQNNGTINM